MCSINDKSNVDYFLNKSCGETFTECIELLSQRDLLKLQPLLWLELTSIFDQHNLTLNKKKLHKKRKKCKYKCYNECCMKIFLILLLFQKILI